MKFLHIFILIVLNTAQIFSQQLSFGEKYYTSVEDNALWLATIRHSISFFDAHAYNTAKKTYYSELDNQGKKTSQKVHVLALSRMIYSLAYSSKYFPENLQKAKDAADFILQNMLDKDRYGPYFRATYEDGKGALKEDMLKIWEQAYGFCGLVELYRVTKDPKLLDTIHALFGAFVKRFKDGQGTGFYENYSLTNGQVTDFKSYASTMYVATSFLINLWEADTQKEWKGKYEQYLKELSELVVNHFWDEDREWVREKFNPDWSPCAVSETDATPCYKINTGHDFQTAWFLLRAASWDFITNEKKQAMRKTGLKILHIMLKKPIWDQKKESFFQQFDPVSQECSDLTKAWWQQAEAIMAYDKAYKITSHKKYKKVRDRLITFYTQHFFDFTHGGEYFKVDPQNQPITQEGKGSKGKSSYHVTELARFILE